MNIFKRFRAYLRFKEAVRQADRAYEKTQQRYYVLPTPDGKLIIMERRNFRLLKRKGYIARYASIYGLERGCLYHTPYANGRKRMSKERMEEQYSFYLSMLDKKGSI